MSPKSFAFNQLIIVIDGVFKHHKFRDLSSSLLILDQQRKYSVDKFLVPPNKFFFRDTVSNYPKLPELSRYNRPIHLYVLARVSLFKISKVWIQQLKPLLHISCRYHLFLCSEYCIPSDTYNYFAYQCPLLYLQDQIRMQHDHACIHIYDVPFVFFQQSPLHHMEVD